MHQIEQKQSEDFLSSAGALTGCRGLSETVSVQQSAERGSHAQFTAGILAAGERREEKMCEAGRMSTMESSMESSRKVFDRLENTDLCHGGGETSMMFRQVKLG